MDPVASTSLAGELIAQVTYAFQGGLTINGTEVPLVLQWTMWSYSDSLNSLCVSSNLKP